MHDIISKLVERNGHIRLTDIRVNAEITHMAMNAWRLLPEDKEEPNVD